jgi:hypothetical protein
MRFVIATSILVAAVAFGQAAYVCDTAACVGSTGQDVNLGGTVIETRGPRPDGGQAILKPAVASAVLQVLGNQSRTSTLPDVIIGGSNARDGGSPIVSIRTGGYEVWSVAGSGAIAQGASTLGATTISRLTVTSDAGIGGNLGVTGNAAITGTAAITGATDVTGALTVESSKNHGSVLMDGGAQTITVTAGELCICQDSSDNTKGCKMPVSSTTGTISSTTGDTVVYHCF